jgi:hypothetical protein
MGTAALFRSWLASGPLMSASVAVTLYVLPYQQKYLLKKLGDLARVAYTPYGMHAMLELQRILGKALQGVERGSTTNHVLLRIVAPPDFLLSENQQKRLNGFVHALMARELVETVEFLRGLRGLRKLDAIEEFKGTYDITEDDWGLMAAKRSYYRTRRRIAKRHFAPHERHGVSPL